MPDAEPEAPGLSPVLIDVLNAALEGPLSTRDGNFCTKSCGKERPDDSAGLFCFARGLLSASGDGVAGS